MAKAALKSRNQLWVDVDTASQITGIEVATLLDWERFFYPFLNPDRVKGEARYGRADLDVLAQITRLIHHGGFRKEGAKRALAWNYKRAA